MKPTQKRIDEIKQIIREMFSAREIKEHDTMMDIIYDDDEYESTSMEQRIILDSLGCLQKGRSIRQGKAGKEILSIRLPNNWQCRELWTEAERIEYRINNKITIDFSS